MELANHPQVVDSARLTVPIATGTGTGTSTADVGSDSAVAESLASRHTGFSLDA